MCIEKIETIKDGELTIESTEVRLFVAYKDKTLLDIDLAKLKGKTKIQISDKTIVDKTEVKYAAIYTSGKHYYLRIRFYDSEIEITPVMSEEKAIGALKMLI